MNPSTPNLNPNNPFPVLGMASNLTQIWDTLQNIVTAINGLQQTTLINTTNIITAIEGISPTPLTSSTTWTPGAIGPSTQVTKAVTCAGATLGMAAQASFSLDLQDLSITSYVNAANDVTVVLLNGTSSTVTIGAGVVKVWTHS